MNSLVAAVSKSATSPCPAWIPAADYAFTSFLAACRVQGLDTALRSENASDRVLSGVGEILHRQMRAADSLVQRGAESGGQLDLLVMAAEEHERRGLPSV